MMPPPSFVDTIPVAEAAETGEAREGGRRRRRGRGGRDRDEARQGEAAAGEVSVEARAEVEAEPVPMGEPAVQTTEEGAPAADAGERESRRRGRGRDRHRRERRDEEATTGVEAAPEMPASELPHAAEPLREEAPEPIVVERVAAAPVAPQPVPVAPPAVVEAFVLPTTDLQAVAEAAGLQWVNSDVEKIRAVQEAMAREPKPVHVPREPKPVVAVDEGPLVLVETRKDLSQFKLPFEAAQGSQPQA